MSSFTLHQTKHASFYGQSGSITLDSAPTVGSQIIVCIYANSIATNPAPTTAAFSAGASPSFSSLTSKQLAGAGYIETKQRTTIGGESSQIDWTISGGVDRGVNVHVYEVTGINAYPSSFAVNSSDTSGTSTAPISGTMTVARDDVFAIAFAAWLDDTTTASAEAHISGGITTAMTERNERTTSDPAGAGSKGRSVVYDYDFSPYGSGAATIGCTLSASEGWVQIAMVFRTSASVPSMTSAQLSATIRALAAADKPLLCGLNEIRYAIAGKWTTSGNVTHPDLAATGYLSKYSYDDHTDAVTKPASAQTTWYLGWDLALSPANDLDCLFILNHNLLTIGATVTIEAANVAGFTTITPLVAAHAIASSGRLAYLSFGGNQSRYTNVRFLRLKIVCGSAATPQIGEVFCGIRRQLKHKAVDGWDPRNLRSEVAVFESSSGKPTAYVRHQGRRIVDGVFNPHESAYVTDFEEFFEDCEHGSLPFVLVDDPGTYPTRYELLRMDPPELRGPLDGPSERQFRLTAKEVGPHFRALEG